MATFNVDKALAAGKTPDQIKAFLAAHPDVQPSKPLNAPQQPQQGLGSTIVNAALPAPAQAVQAGMQAPQNVQEGLIRGGATEVGQLMAGPPGAGAGAMAGNTAVDLMNSPAARQAIGQGAQGMATGNPQDAVLAPLKAAMNNPDAVLNSLKNSAQQGAAATIMSSVLGGLKAKIGAPTGPKSVGFQNPETAIPEVISGAGQKAGEAVGAAQKVAFAGEDIGNLPELLQSGPGIRKLGSAARQVAQLSAEEIKALPNSQLVALRTAAGKLQSAGGPFANEYKQAYDTISGVLTDKAPDLMQAKAASHLMKMAGSSATEKFPWFTTALNPEVGAVKALTLPTVQNMGGAAARVGLEASVPGSAALMEALTRLKNSRGGQRP